jgi:Ca2+/H+ antiporter, TMEM165/GDT1 family
MDVRLLASTFAAVFLAELGDKTQLATMSLASANASRWTVFIASASALVTSTALAVLVGELVAKAVPPVWIKRGAGLLFVVIGGLYLWQSLAKPAEAEARAQVDQSADQK